MSSELPLFSVPDIPTIAFWSISASSQGNRRAGRQICDHDALDGARSGGRAPDGHRRARRRRPGRPGRRSTAPPAARLAALRALEGDRRHRRGSTLGLDASWTTRPKTLSAAAIAALRPHVRGAGGAGVVDRLTAIAMDRRAALQRARRRCGPSSISTGVRCGRCSRHSATIRRPRSPRWRRRAPPASRLRKNRRSCSPEPRKDGSPRTRRCCGALWRKLATRCR